jgi:hypothetical protein
MAKGITPKPCSLTPEKVRIQALEKQVKQLQSIINKRSTFFAMEMNNGKK